MVFSTQEDPVRVEPIVAENVGATTEICMIIWETKERRNRMKERVNGLDIRQVNLQAFSYCMTFR